MSQSQSGTRMGMLLITCQRGFTTHSSNSVKCTGNYIRVYGVYCVYGVYIKLYSCYSATEHARNKLQSKPAFADSNPLKQLFWRPTILPSCLLSHLGPDAFSRACHDNESQPFQILSWAPAASSTFAGPKAQDQSGPAPRGLQRRPGGFQPLPLQPP